MNSIQPKVDPKKLQLALLKSGYLLIFRLFGYNFILDPAYNVIREQLLNPEKDLYPLDFWFKFPTFPPDKMGVPFITEKGMEAIMPVFNLKTPASKRVFGNYYSTSNQND